jgi:hypothetical protein
VLGVKELGDTNFRTMGEASKFRSLLPPYRNMWLGHAHQCRPATFP